MASLNGFGVSILTNGKALAPTAQEAGTYFLMPHESRYAISLINTRSTKCDAELTVDGKSMGRFRVAARDSILIERPSEVNQAFIFVKEDSKEAKGLVQKGEAKNGLISVTFTPEEPQRAPRYVLESKSVRSRGGDVSEEDCEETLECASASCKDRNRSASRGPAARGATVLGEKTKQSFVDAEPISGIDYINVTTIHVRLGVLPGYTALTNTPQYSMPIPPPLRV